MQLEVKKAKMETKLTKERGRMKKETKFKKERQIKGKK